MSTAGLLVRWIGRLIGGAALMLLTACGGGGGSSPAPPPTAPPITSVPPAGTLLVPGRQSSGGGAGGFVNDGRTASTYTVTSSPALRPFTVGGVSYTSPAIVTPSVAANPLAIVFASGFTVPIAQVKDGPHTVYYNAESDSTGSVVLASLQSATRQPAAGGLRAAIRVHRQPQRPARVVGDVDPTRVAVRLSASALRASGRTPAGVESAAGSSGVATLSATLDPLRVVTVPAGVDVATLTRRLRAQPEVADVTPVHRLHLLARAPTVVTDPGFNVPDQWYTFATGANYAWSYSPGSGAKFAIIDTGIDQNNTDLSSQVVFSETAVTPIDNTPATSGAVPTCNPLAGATTVVTPNTAQDDNGHGTNVAGIAIAKQDTAGFAGAAWGAALLAIKIFPDQNQYCNGTAIEADSADLAQAIADAVTQGADVISLSLGGSSYDTITFNAVESALQAGVTVVAAAGNSADGEVAGTLDYPAAYPGVISVGASALKDEYSAAAQPQQTGTYSKATEVVASYSQYATSLSVVAPGGDPSACTIDPSSGRCPVYDQDVLHWILNAFTSTAYAAADACPPGPATGCAALFAGTSMATPQVAATAAMLVAEAGGHGRLSPTEVKYAIERTADNINDPKQGHGRLNAYRALASLVRDTSAYTGPAVQPAGTTQLVAFAYTVGSTNRAGIVDASFPAGVPVNADGTFRIADVPVADVAFRVAVWYDANGDGVVDAGDQVGVSPTVCSTTALCAIGKIVLQPVTAGFFLP